MASYCFGNKKHKDSQESSCSTKILVNGNSNHCDKFVNTLTNGHIIPQAVICKEMCYYCFDVLTSNLNNQKYPITPSFTNKPFPLFVTWSSGKEKKLRGCIGTFSEQPLHSGLKEYAISSALKDSRFSPVSRHEIQRLSCTVSLLINFESNLKYMDWTVGIHGIRIEFIDDKGINRLATYLPNVAIEQNWTHVEAIDSLICKAGYKGYITDDLRQSIKLTRYQSEKCCASYEEFASHKQNI